MKSISTLFLLAVISQSVFNRDSQGTKTTVKRRIVDQTGISKPKERRLNFDDELQLGSSYVQAMENTHANLSELSGHSKNRAHMKKINNLFSDVEERLDDFRDAIARKLNELHMALQRPKVPVMGPASMMLHPSMNPVISAVSNAMPSFADRQGPAVNSMYDNAFGLTSQVSNSGLMSKASAIASSFDQSVQKAPERLLLNTQG